MTTSSDIYKASMRRCLETASTEASATEYELTTLEHVVRAMLDILTPEQRAEVLKKVTR